MLTSQDFIFLLINYNIIISDFINNHHQAPSFNLKRYDMNSPVILYETFVKGYYVIVNDILLFLESRIRTPNPSLNMCILYLIKNIKERSIIGNRKVYYN